MFMGRNYIIIHLVSKGEKCVKYVFNTSNICSNIIVLASFKRKVFLPCDSDLVLK